MNARVICLACQALARMPDPFAAPHAAYSWAVRCQCAAITPDAIRALRAAINEADRKAGLW